MHLVISEFYLRSVCRVVDNRSRLKDSLFVSVLIQGRTMDEIVSKNFAGAGTGASSTQPSKLSFLPKSYGWINPALSVIITLGFLILVFLLLFYPQASGANTRVFNIALGALATAFATVIGFHFGSSIGSKEKDAIIAENAAQKTEPAI